MPFPVASLNDVYGVYFFGTWHNQSVVTTFKYFMSQITGAPTVDSIYAELVGFVVTANKLRDKFIACCPLSYTMNSIGVQRLTPTRVVRGGQNTPGVVGTFVTDSTTANLAGFINRRTVDGTRRGHGGIHVPYPNLITGPLNGTLPANYKTALDACSAALLETYVGTLATYVPCLMKAGGTIQDAKAIQFVTSMPNIRTMRSRTVGHGK